LGKIDDYYYYNYHYCYRLLLVCDTPAVSGSSLCPETAGYKSSSYSGYNISGFQAPEPTTTAPPPNTDYGAECSDDSGLPMHLRRLHLFERLKQCLGPHGVLPHQEPWRVQQHGRLHVPLSVAQPAGSEQPAWVHLQRSHQSWVPLSGQQPAEQPATVFDGLMNKKTDSVPHTTSYLHPCDHL
jgi:hypothetical protein